MIELTLSEVFLLFSPFLVGLLGYWMRAPIVIMVAGLMAFFIGFELFTGGLIGVVGLYGLALIGWGASEASR